MTFSNKTILITGASKGIGAAAAEVLHGLGANLVLMARGQAALDALAARLGPDRVLTVTGDVADYATVVVLVVVVRHRSRPKASNRQNAVYL